MAEGMCLITASLSKNEDISIYTVPQLKRYLSNHRQNVSGRKAQLIDRIIGTYKLKIQDNASLAKTDLEQQEKSVEQRFRLISGERFPQPVTLSGWEKDLDKIPDLTEKDLYNYVVLKKNSKRQMKSKTFYDDGHVNTVEVHPIDDKSSHLYIRALVLPSFPTADQKKSPDYRPWILVSKITGCIHSAYCTCPAGEGECCNHIGALLFGIVDLTEKRKEGTLASTSKKCTWSNFSMPRKRKLSPKRAQDLNFKKSSLVPSVRKLNLERNESINLEIGCTADTDRFKQRLQTNSLLNVGWLKNFPCPVVEPDLPGLHDIRFLFSDNVDLETKKDFFQTHFDAMAQSEEDIVKTEVVTRGQGKSTKWVKARQERITSSQFGTICKRKATTNSTIIKSILYSSFSSKYTEYGKKYEKVARRCYVKHMQVEHRGLQVKECGLFVKKDAPFLGSSPDGVVFCSHCDASVGLLEVKCPASMRWRKITPEECCSHKDFCCHIADGCVKLKKNHNYYYQVQGQMAITGKSWCDFVILTCRGISVERIFFDQEMWNDMYQKLEQFYIRYFLPELFTRRVERGKELYN